MNNNATSLPTPPRRPLHCCSRELAKIGVNLISAKQDTVWKTYRLGCARCNARWTTLVPAPAKRMPAGYWKCPNCLNGACPPQPAANNSGTTNTTATNTNSGTTTTGAKS